MRDACEKPRAVQKKCKRPTRAAAGHAEADNGAREATGFHLLGYKTSGLIKTTLVKYKCVITRPAAVVVIDESRVTRDHARGRLSRWYTDCAGSAATPIYVPSSPRLLSS